MKDFLSNISEFHYKKSFSIQSLPLFLLLFIPSLFYSFVIKFKNLLYAAGILKEKKSKAKVICIGNLTTGGVGKTPVVIEFCKYLAKNGKKVASLSRGYGGKLKGINVIKDFNTPILINDSSLTGDEVQLIAKNAIPEADFACLTSSDRLKGANYAAENLNAEIIVMDDGFSNRKIKKDLTLLLFDSKKFIGNGFLLPLGPLREPLNQIKRADGIILVDKEGSDPIRLQKNADYLYEKFKKPVFTAKFEIDYFYNIKTGEKTQINLINDVFAFCGIGSPEQFYNYLKPLNLLNVETFNDHYAYSVEDIKNILNKAKKEGANFIVTTEKDAVKIKDFIISDSKNVLAMKLKPVIDVEKIIKSFSGEF